MYPERIGMLRRDRSPFAHLSLLLNFYREEHHKGKTSIPETKGVEEGSSKRNIQRKHSHDPHQKEKKQGGGGGGKGQWNPVDDGSME